MHHRWAQTPEPRRISRRASDEGTQRVAANRFLCQSRGFSSAAAKEFAVLMSETDCQELKDLKGCISQRTDDRFPITAAVELCCLLHPSTKDSLDMSREKQIACLVQAAKENEPCKCWPNQPDDSFPSPSSPSHEDSPVFAVSKKRRLLEQRKSECNSASQSDQLKLEEEASRYLMCTATEEESDDPLVFWRKNESIFPHLAHFGTLISLHIMFFSGC